MLVQELEHDDSQRLYTVRGLTEADFEPLSEHIRQFVRSLGDDSTVSVVTLKRFDEEVKEKYVVMGAERE